MNFVLTLGLDPLQLIAILADTLTEMKEAQATGLEDVSSPYLPSNTRASQSSTLRFLAGMKGRKRPVLKDH